MSKVVGCQIYFGLDVTVSLDMDLLSVMFVHFYFILKRSGKNRYFFKRPDNYA